MRLTLRTLLAYRDGVMGPKDAEDLHQRVQSSEVAANLLKRIESVSQGVQAASATIVGKGLVGDPNYLAEYLDDTLHGEKVPELEKLCLESNAHLAELAACHQILSSAMHTRVKLPDRMHQLAVDVGDKEKREEIRQRLADHKKRNRSQPGSPHFAPTPNGQPIAEPAEPAEPATQNPRLQPEPAQTRSASFKCTLPWWPLVERPSNSRV